MKFLRIFALDIWAVVLFPPKAIVRLVKSIANNIQHTYLSYICRHCAMVWTDGTKTLHMPLQDIITECKNASHGTHVFSLKRYERSTGIFCQFYSKDDLDSFVITLKLKGIECVTRR